MNTPVSFELAKLLKEKGFDEYCMLKYFLKKPRDYGINWKPNEAYNISGYDGVLLERKYIDQDVFIYAPTISDVVMWLYEKHGVWTVVNVNIMGSWYFEHFDLKEKRNAQFKPTDTHYDSPTEAYEAAIKYTLKNLL